jgi:hypothetical protein
MIHPDTQLLYALYTSRLTELFQIDLRVTACCWSDTSTWEILWRNFLCLKFTPISLLLFSCYIVGSHLYHSGGVVYLTTPLTDHGIWAIGSKSLYIYIYIYIYMCVCVRVFVCVCMYYVYINRRIQFYDWLRVLSCSGEHFDFPLNREGRSACNSAIAR